MASKKYPPHPAIIEHADGTFSTFSKRCTKCRTTKLMDEFGSATDNADGRRGMCKECANSAKRDRRASRKGICHDCTEPATQGVRCDKHAASQRSRQKRYEQRHPERVKESGRIRTARYREANPEAVQESRRRQTARLKARTPDEITAARDRLRPSGLKHCHRCDRYKPFSEFYELSSLADGLTALCVTCSIEVAQRKLRKKAIDRWEDLDLWRCTYCDAPFEDVEHVIPRAQGGTDHPENLVPACANCNRGPGGKFDRTPAEWRPAEHATIRAAVGLARRVVI